VEESGMTALVTALTGILNTDAMVSNLALLVPVLGGVIIFAFTYRIVKKMIKGTSKGKANL